MTTILLGLIGFPLGHSRSPAIHNAALRALGLEGEYRLYPAPPLPEGELELEYYLNELRIGDILGLNVTIPHKQSVLGRLEDLTPTAQTIGAVNTILTYNGRLRGENTDAAGFLADLQRLAPDLFQGPLDLVGGGSFDKVGKRPSALVLGAGGSARAVVCALIKAGFNVTIAARHLEQADQIFCNFQQTVDGESHHSIVLDCPGLTDFIKQSPSPTSLIVNTTPLGMSPQIEASPWPDGLDFPKQAVLYDLVYNPAETTLMRQARRAGLSAFGGLGMLVEQAALAFTLWTGLPAPREIMREAAKQV